MQEKQKGIKLYVAPELEVATNINTEAYLHNNNIRSNGLEDGQAICFRKP